MSDEMRATAERLERAAEDFRAKYGLGEYDAFDDATLERALADHGLPRLDALGASGVGNRERAAHLLGHVIAQHESPRCRACAHWGPS